jgi:hypothetical protein
MADNKSSTHSHEWIAISIWLGLLLATLVTSIYVLSNLNLPGQILANFSSAFAQANPLTGQTGGTALGKGILYVNLLLYLGSIYFMVTAWLKLSSMLLEVVIHYASETHTEPVFATMLYLSRMSRGDKAFDPDDAVGSMPGEIVRNLGFVWVMTFLIFGLSTALPYFL